MRAAIIPAVCVLFSSSVFTAEPQVKNAAGKPVLVAMVAAPAPSATARKVGRAAAIETAVPEGSLEKFGSCCLPQ
jgi:hypothetical protein